MGDAAERVKVLLDDLVAETDALVDVVEEARRWMGIAQAFAGPPGPGREPRHKR